MKTLLEFFITVSKLGILKRTGWVWRGVKDPETVAEHSFRLTFFTWLLGQGIHLNMKRALVMALFHDLCETYAGDLTPHYGTPNHKKIKAVSQSKEREELLKRWIRLSQKEKIRASQLRKSAERKALLMLVRSLPPSLRQEVFGLWVDFENGLSVEGKFVKQLDKLEVLLQAIEYFGTGSDTFVTAWWEEAEEVVDHPVLVQFLHDIQSQLYDKKKARADGILPFLMDVGKLKRKPRPIWLIRKVKNPNSEANHTFMLTLMAWMFAKGKDRAHLDIEKVLKMALASRLGFVNHDQALTRYDTALKTARTQAQKKVVLEKGIRHSIKEKKELFFASYKKEKKALDKLVEKLEPRLKSEILYFWNELKSNQAPEARFVNQIYVLEVLLRALQYWAKDKKFAIEPWWEKAFEFSNSSINLEFMAELEKHFYSSSQKKKQSVAKV